MSENSETPVSGHATNFIRNIIEDDLAQGANLPRYWCGRPAPYSEQLKEGAPDEAKIRTRFPPEPNGYLHIGHAKSICLNFGLARDYGGYCHMRFDDTNPVKEDQEYVDGIMDSVRWLGFNWEHGKEKNLYFASSYFEYMYRFAEHLITTGYAYVDEQTADEMRDNRGTLKEPGKNSPYRDRSVEENLRLFREMREGKHAEGSMVLRAKIDMASPNINLRDPAIYRIRFAEHHATGNAWCIYPMYTFAHPIEDSLENITHSICTLEFEDQRAFYDWALERIVPVLRTPQYEEARALIAKMASGEDDRALPFAARALAAKEKLGQSEPECTMRRLFDAWGEKAPETLEDASMKEFFALLEAHPENFTPLMQAALEVVRKNFFLLSHQYEFNRLNLTYVVVSKRKLIQLVTEKYVDGWDDPRMPTIVGLRRRGFTPESLQSFAERCGVSKVSGGWIDYSVLEQCLREDLEARALRRMAVMKPLKLIIDNYPEGASEELLADNHPQKPELGQRKITFSRELWIEETDFAEVPPPKFKRLTVDGEVRLMGAYIVKCTGVDKNADGSIAAIHCTADLETGNGNPADGRKVKGTIHWVSAAHCVDAEVRLYDKLFTEANMNGIPEGSDYKDYLNPESVTVRTGCKLEESLKDAKPGEKFQFVRTGFFTPDSKNPGVYNRVVTLRDSFKPAK